VVPAAGLSGSRGGKALAVSASIRLPPALRSDIESSAKKQNDKPSRSEAIRRLIEFALAVKTKGQNSADR